jgi:uncharacterized membrane protein
MQNVTNQPQAPDEHERGYAPVPPPEYREGADPQSGYQQHYYQPGQPYPPSYQGWQQQYWRPQPGGMWAPGDVNPFERTSMGMKVGTAGVLCYLFGWVGGLVFFLLERDNRFLRFHATQSILFFGTMSILGWVSSFFPFVLFGLGGVVGLVGFIGWIVLMVAAHRGRYYKLPLFGDFVEQLANRVSI